MAVELARITRGDLVETIHRGDVVVVGADGRTLRAWPAMPGRSPICGRRPSLSRRRPRRRVAACRSASASRSKNWPSSAPHTAASRCTWRLSGRFLARIGLDEDALGCGAHAPSYAPAAIALYRAGQKHPRRFQNTTVQASTAVCEPGRRPLALPRRQYPDPIIPVQQHILHSVADDSGLGTRTITVAVDGCSAPVFGLPLYGMALMYARLVSPQRLLA